MVSYYSNLQKSMPDRLMSLNKMCPQMCLKMFNVQPLHDQKLQGSRKQRNSEQPVL